MMWKLAVSVTWKEKIDVMKRCFQDLSYKDKHWHEACFLCNRCRVSLVDKQFGSKVDKIYCGNCYDAQFASRCDGCGEIFRAGMLTLYNWSSNMKKVLNISQDFVAVFSSMNMFIRYLYPTLILHLLVTFVTAVYNMHRNIENVSFLFNSTKNEKSISQNLKKIVFAVWNLIIWEKDSLVLWIIYAIAVNCCNNSLQRIKTYIVLVSLFFSFLKQNRKK